MTLVRRRWLWLVALVVAIATLGILGPTGKVPLGLGVPAASAAYNPGQVCNNSSVSIWITLEPLGQPWRAAQLGSRQCTTWGLQDAEAVWGKRCDFNTGSCWYVSWKVTGYTTTTVRDGYISPIPPGRALFVSGSGSWVTAPEWPRPSLGQISYDLR